MTAIVVTGAAGNIGRRVVDLIASAGAAEITAVVRRPYEFDSSAVTAAFAEYDDCTALHKAFAGAHTLVLITSDGDAVSVIEHHRNIVSAATDAGISKVVVLSGLDSSAASPFCYSKVFCSLERMLFERSFEVSVVRTSIFAEFFAKWVTAARKRGDIRLPMADGRISLVGRNDVAAALAALAIDPRPGTYNITGPQSLSGAELAQLGSERFDIPMKFTDITPQELLIELARSGSDPWWMYAYFTMFQSIREQRWAAVSTDFCRLVKYLPANFASVLPEL